MSETLAAPTPTPRRWKVLAGSTALATALVASGGAAWYAGTHDPAAATSSSAAPGVTSLGVSRTPWPSSEVGRQTGGTTTDADAEQSSGLVEITSTLTNGKAAGTGLIWTSNGIVVTNHHVVAGATSVRVTDVATGTTYTARYVGGDATADVAVLKLAGASGLDTVDLAEVAASPGEAVTAVGDAGGDGGSLTAADGTVTATGQDITVTNDDGSTSSLADLVRISASVVPGDSGGAVLNEAGDVVGLTVAASSGGPEVAGYAIPVATVESVVSRIRAGRADRTISLGYGGYLGVALNPDTTAAVVLETLEGGAAATAGISAGSTVTGLGGTRITSGDQLRALLADLDPGDRVRVTWTTAAGTSRSATVDLGRAPIA